MQKEMYKSINNSPATVLTVKAESSDTVFTVDDISAFPEAPNLAVVTDTTETEIILYSGIEGNKLTGVTRGINGTTARVWEIGVQIARTYTSYDHDTFIDNIEDLEDRKVDDSELGSLAKVESIDLDSSVVYGVLPVSKGGTGRSDGKNLVPQVDSEEPYAPGYFLTRDYNTEIGLKWVYWRDMLRYPPSQYTRLEYIASTNDKQYINTGFNFQSGGRFIVELEFTDIDNANTNCCIIGAQSGTSSAARFIARYNNDANKTFALYPNGGGSVFNAFNVRLNKKVKLEINSIAVANMAYVLVDDVKVNRTSSSGTLAVPTNANSLYLLAFNSNTSGVATQFANNCRVYSAKFYNRYNVLTYDFVPAKSSDGTKVGLYDLVTDMFFENANTNGVQFEAGPIYIEKDDANV